MLDSSTKTEEKIDEARTVFAGANRRHPAPGRTGEKLIKEICREHNITETTFYRWRKIYAGISVSEAHRLKELEKENSRLKRLLAERDLEIDALKEYLAKK